MVNRRVWGEPTEHTQTPQKYFPRLPRLQRMQVGDEIVELLRGQRAADGWHHIAAADNGLTDESFIGGQAARQKLLLEKPLQMRTILSRNRMRVVAWRTALPIQ